MVAYRNCDCNCDAVQDGAGQWLSMDSEIIMKNGEPIGTQGPTGHYVLLDAHFELPSGKSLPHAVARNKTAFLCTLLRKKFTAFDSGVDPYGTGGTCPPNIYFGGTCLSMSPQYLGVFVLETSIFSRHLITRSPSFAATSIDSLQLQRIFFLRNCRLNCSGSNYM